MPKKKNKKSKEWIENETKIREWVFGLWRDFNESPEKRQTVLDTFDEAINQHFVSKPHIAKWFEGVKEAFLKSEVKNK